MLYFDCNATAPVCQVARETWLRAVEEYVGNPSSQHRMGKRAERALEEARGEMAALIGCDAEELVWTSGATEGVNTVVAHLAAESSGGGEAWVSAIEHPCMIESVRRWFPGRAKLVPVGRAGLVDVGWISDQLRQGSRPALVAVMAANNETGVLQPWREVQALCRSAGVPFVCDAAQWVGKMPTARVGECDYLIGCGHKFGAPPGVGFLKCAGGRMRPMIVGGPQEEGRRAGTESLAAVLATVATLRERVYAISQATGTERLATRNQFIDRVLSAVEGSRLVGGESERLWNTVSLMLPVPDCRVRWVVKLDKAGVAVSTGSACASGKEKVSHVLEAMGLSAGEASGVVRFSSGWETTRGDWEKLAETLEGVWLEMNAS